MSGRSDVDRLRRKVVAELALVVLGTVALELAHLRWGLPASLTRPASVGSHFLFVLAVSHVLMLVFGARRGRELRAAFAQRQRAQELLLHQATHDPVTGLVNRATLQDGIARDLAAGQVALVRLRLQGLEEIAATLGHALRDDVLAGAARRLEQRLQDTGRPGGIVASVQHDDFAVLLPGLDEEQARVRAGLLLACLLEPLPVGPARLEVRACAGVAVAPAVTTGPGLGVPARDAAAAELLGRAEVALQAAAGQVEPVVYRPDLDRRDARRLNLHGELRRGIAAGELRLHHQVKVSLSTGLVTGVEALVRWQHPTRGLLSPADFLDLAEHTGLITELTAVVLDEALADHVRWVGQGRTLPVAVNLSRRCLSDPALPQRVAAALALHGVDPCQLELEVTESIAAEDPRQALAVLRALRDVGVGVSMDDYGTGQSSLTSLSQLPLTSLKLDRSFVLAMHSSSRDLTIIRSTIELSHGLGHRAVAEGVETHEAWRWLQTLNCDEAQGVWLARPVPASELLGSVQEVEQRLARLRSGGLHGLVGLVAAPHPIPTSP